MRGRVLRMALGLTVCVVAGGCGGGTDDPPHAVVIGNSLTFQADGNSSADDDNGVLRRELEDRGYEVEGGGVIGLSIPVAYEVVWPEIENRRPETLVISLGTNDAHDGAVPVERARDAMERWTARVPDTCLVLVGVNEQTEAWGLDEHAPSFNAMLEDLASDHPDGHFVPWEPDPDRLGRDGVHLNDEGRSAYRETIVDGVERCEESA